jgi:hypothetical protein
MPRLGRALPFMLVAAIATAAAAMLWPERAWSHETVNTTISFDREISRILVSRCITCHTTGSLAFPLTTYEQTRPWARAIEEEVLSRHMPPWRAVAGYGAFVNDGGLSTRELQTIVAWVEGNGPKTKDQTTIVNIDQQSTSPDQQLKPDFATWQYGSPAIVRPVGRGTAQSIDGDTVMRTSIELGNDAEQRLAALEFKPADRTALRAASFSLEGTGQWLASWTPWHAGLRLPSNVAYVMPRRARIIAELRYRQGAAVPGDVGSLGVSLALSASECPTDIILSSLGEVPPHATSQKFQATTTVAIDTSLLALIPDLRDGIHALEVRARRPDGSVQVLLLVRDVLREWPTPYLVKTPVPLPKGTELLATAYYTNPTDAPRPGGVTLRVSTVSDGRACATH